MRLSVPPVVFALLAACGGGGSATPDAAPEIDAAPSPVCIEARSHSDLAWLQDNVFTPSCANFNACHKGNATSASGLNLEAGNTEANMVNQPSKLFSQYDLVVPGDLQNSYLMIILGSQDGPLDMEITMPYNNPLLCIDKRDAIERWITALSASTASPM